MGVGEAIQKSATEQKELLENPNFAFWKIGIKKCSWNKGSGKYSASSS